MSCPTRTSSCRPSVFKSIVRMKRVVYARIWTNGPTRVSLRGNANATNSLAAAGSYEDKSSARYTRRFASMPILKSCFVRMPNDRNSVYDPDKMSER